MYKLSLMYSSDQVAKKSDLYKIAKENGYPFTHAKFFEDIHTGRDLSIYGLGEDCNLKAD